MSQVSFAAMGTTVNLRINAASSARVPGMLTAGRHFIEGFDAKLSRFKAASELSCINSSPDESVEVSWLMGEFIRSALWAAEASGGLVDPTLVPALERAGYGESRSGVAPADLTQALLDAPARAAANPDRRGDWRGISYDEHSRVLTRPAGTRIDSGGAGKGLAADLLARIWSVSLGDRADFMVDCGGDIRFGPLGNPWGQVNVEDPFGGASLPLACIGGAVATSSIRNRIWRGTNGAPSHHLIDPATGDPAWTGVVAVTALAPTALVAETIAKTAFLRGAGGACETLAAADGGLVIFDDGACEYVTPALKAAA